MRVALRTGHLPEGGGGSRKKRFMWRTIPVALFCWLILIASVRAQDVFVPRELKPKSTEKSDKSSADQTVSEKVPAPSKQSEAAAHSPKTASVTEPPASLHSEKTQSDQIGTAKIPAKAPSLNSHPDKKQVMKFEPVRPLSGKEPPISSHLEKTQPTKLEPVKMPKELTSEPQLEKVQSAKVESAVKESPTNPHPEKVQSAKAEPEKPVALKEKEKTRSEKSQTAKAEPDKLKAAKGLVGSPPAEKIKSAKTEPEKPAVVKETAAKSEKVQSAKVEPDKLPGTKEPEAKNRGGKIQSAKAEPEQSSVVKESAIKSQKVQTAKIEPEKAAPKESARSEKVQAAKVELPKAVKEKTIPNSRSEQVQLAKFEPIKPPGAKEPVVSLQPEKTQTDKPEAAKIPSQEPTVDIQLSDRTTETAATKLADGFDFPVGKPEAEGYYKARGFRSGGHMGEDWDGIRGGDTDLKDPIYCIGNGIVVFARDVHRGWGNVVIVRHAYRENGAVKHIDSLYGHLHSILVKRGQRVARGQQIGTMGTAHGQYDAHLHLEIRKNLEIGMSRAKFAKNFSNYYDPSQFIESHRRLSGGGATFRVAMNTFTHDAAFHFDNAPNYSARKRSTSQSAAALKQAVSGTR
ncbi:MAG TPA: peptidoglycan DD-metalloendopeptidase family protein [Chthoniobacterales bacterium]|nr:peptidoglycan DD-metalloendopeptidase family protein [Chthoniobacterales bacterium]